MSVTTSFTGTVVVLSPAEIKALAMLHTSPLLAWYLGMPRSNGRGAELATLAQAITMADENRARERAARGEA